MSGPQYRNIKPVFLYGMFVALFLNGALCQTLHRLTPIARFTKWIGLAGVSYPHALMLILALGGMFYTRRPLSHFGLHFNVRGQWKTVRWWFLGFLFIPLSYLIGQSFPISKFVESLSALDNEYNWSIVKFMMVAFVCIAFGEELMFRGFLLTELGKHKRGWIRLKRLKISKANFLSAVLFGVGHMSNVGWVIWWTNPTVWDYAHPLVVQPIAAFLVGLLLGHLKERTGGLLWPVLWHFLIGDINNIYLIIRFIGKGILLF